MNHLSSTMTPGNYVVCSTDGSFFPLKRAYLLDTSKFTEEQQDLLFSDSDSDIGTLIEECGIDLENVLCSLFTASEIHDSIK